MTFLTVPEAECGVSPRFTIRFTTYLTDIASCSGTRVDGYDHTALESECKCSGTVLNFDPAAGIGVVVGVEAEEGGRLKSYFITAFF